MAGLCEFQPMPSTDIATSSTALEGDPAQECHLLTIPRELRDNIIEDALVMYENEGDTLMLVSSDASDFKQPALAYVNRQLREKTLPIFYSKTFVIKHVNKDEQLERMEGWLRCIQWHLHKIKKVKIIICDDHATTLEISAPSGAQAEARVYGRGCHSKTGFFEYCDVEDLVVKIGDELRSICNGVGEAGFGPDEYLRAVKLFLFPEERRCGGYGSQYDCPPKSDYPYDYGSLTVDDDSVSDGGLDSAEGEDSEL